MSAQPLRRPNQPITINVRASDRTGQKGGRVDTWNLLRDDFAFVEDKTFRETASNGNIRTQKGKQFRIRRDDTITAKLHQIVYNGATYNIRAIKVDDRNTRSEYTIIEGLSGVAQ